MLSNKKTTCEHPACGGAGCLALFTDACKHPIRARYPGELCGSQLTK